MPGCSQAPPAKILILGMEEFKSNSLISQVMLPSHALGHACCLWFLYILVLSHSHLQDRAASRQNWRFSSKLLLLQGSVTGFEQGEIAEIANVLNCVGDFHVCTVLY